IDHGLTFHQQPKLRTVLWHFSGDPITAQDLEALQSLRDELRNPRRREAGDLRRLISTVEWRALVLRVERLVSSERFPDPRYKAVPYRW
ncbi:MAG TPA: phosphatidylinositol kinase, partial [Chloroflexi bacterium]|nr:phosphatidylinositol kinase [Chloroflexota bacterium]